MLLSLGHFCLYYSAIRLLFWSYQSISRKDAFHEFGIGFLTVLFCFYALWQGFIESDLSIAYVYNHLLPENSMLPRIGLLWAGPEGANLFFLGAIYAAGVIVFFPHKNDRALLSILEKNYIVYHVAGLIALILWFSSPFKRLWPFPPTEGLELNPLLQDYALSYHPPLLLGATGLFFSIAIGDLLYRSKAEPFKERQALLYHHLGLLFLGMTAGGYWAYHVLGWGGWWFWDPVETISFLTFLGGLVLLHQHMSYWTFSFIRGPAVWAFVLFGLWMVRSEAIVSVHSFVSSWKAVGWLAFATGSFLFSLIILFQSYGNGIIEKKGERFWGVYALWGVTLLGLLVPVIGYLFAYPFHLSGLYFEKNLLHVLIFFLSYRMHKKYGNIMSGIWLLLIALQAADIVIIMFIIVLFSGTLYFSFKQKKLSTIMHGLVLAFTLMSFLQRQESFQKDYSIASPIAIHSFMIEKIEEKKESREGHDYFSYIMHIKKDNLIVGHVAIERLSIPKWKTEKKPIAYWRDSWGHDYGFCMGHQPDHIKIFYRPYMGLLLSLAISFGALLWGYGLFLWLSHMGLWDYLLPNKARRFFLWIGFSRLWKPSPSILRL